MVKSEEDIDFYHVVPSISTDPSIACFLRSWGVFITLFHLLDELCWAAINLPLSGKVVDNAQHENESKDCAGPANKSKHPSALCV